MPRTATLNAGAVLDAAVELVRREGEAALNARNLARALGCSTQPIFRCFASMEDLRTALLSRVHEEYLAFLERYAARSDAPRYKAYGLGYVAFAREEPRLFSLLWLRDRRNETDSPENADWPVFVKMSGEHAGLPDADAERFHLEMWVVVHGIATMLATGYLDLDEPTVSRMLTDVYYHTKRKE